jgi:hypothetical protein
MSESSHYEHRDVNVSGILAAAGVLLVAGVIVNLVSWWVFDLLTAPEVKSIQATFSGSVPGEGLPAAPGLEQIDRTDPKKKEVRSPELYAAEEHRLSTYGWVDQKEGIVRIPIDQAMRLLVETKRLTARPAQTRNATAPGASNSGRLLRREE